VTPYLSPCNSDHPNNFPVGQKTVEHKKVYHKYVLIPSTTACYLTIAGYGFFGGGTYGSLPDAAIWWCLRTGGGGVLTSFLTLGGNLLRVNRFFSICVCDTQTQMRFGYAPLSQILMSSCNGSPRSVCPTTPCFQNLGRLISE